MFKINVETLKLRTVNSVNIIFSFRIKRYETKMWACLKCGCRRDRESKKKKENREITALEKRYEIKSLDIILCNFRSRHRAVLNSSFLCFSFARYCRGDRGNKNCETFSERYRNFSRYTRHVCIYIYIYTHLMLL